MSAPFEIVAAPYNVYLAPTGTAFPLIDAAPASAWVQFGTSGTKSQTQAGVTISSSQTVSEFVAAGGTTPRKRWRTAEGLTVGLTLADVSVTAFAQVMDAAVTVVAPTTALAGESHFEFYRGTQVASYACLIRGISPFNEIFNAQFEIPAVHNEGNPAPAYSLQNPAEIAIELHAFELIANQLCVYRAQSAVHS